MSAAERAQRAVAIRALLADDNIKAAFASIEADLVNEWKSARTAEERENVWRSIDIMERLKTWMQSAASHDLTALRQSGIPKPNPYR